MYLEWWLAEENLNILYVSNFVVSPVTAGGLVPLGTILIHDLLSAKC